jgi:hypothetical protein
MNSSAGKADPYWYEWNVGLEKVIEMLHPDSTIASVEFQQKGVKGWDDVVVRFVDRTTHRYLMYSPQGSAAEVRETRRDFGELGQAMVPSSDLGQHMLPPTRFSGISSL